MQTVNIDPFHIIGLSVRTINGDERAEQDIGGLWQRFMGEGVMAKIPNKVSPEICAIYTNYEGDHTQPYDMILGCKVASLEDVPEGMIGQTFTGGNYAPFQAKGKLSDGVVVAAWHSIWKSDLDRTYSADLEIYGEKAQNPDDAEVDIFIAVS
ncbi:MAG: GyrI-like domain-containing protein [Bacteroidia bacterium]